MPKDLVYPVSINAFRASIPSLNYSVESLSKNRIIRGLHDGNQVCGIAFRAPALTNVPEYQHDADQLAVMSDRRCTVIEWNSTTVFRDQERMIRQARGNPGCDHLEHRILNLFSGILVNDPEHVAKSLSASFRVFTAN